MKSWALVALLMGGVGMGFAESLLGDGVFVKPNPDIETRWHTCENPEGMKGQAEAGGEWKAEENK